MEIVQGTDSHPSADWVYQKAREVLPNISLGTVYRNLNQLVQNNIINIIRIENIVHYDGNIQNHHHFICNTCQKVYDIELNEESIKLDIKVQDHEISNYRLKMWGNCNVCSILINKGDNQNASN